MSDTPRTDAAWYHSDIGGSVVDVELCRQIERENTKLCAGMAEAFKVIDVVYMDALDSHKESWPRAREWMEQWEEFKPSNQATKP